MEVLFGDTNFILVGSLYMPCKSAYAMYDGILSLELHINNLPFHIQNLLIIIESSIVGDQCQK